MANMVIMKGLPGSGKSYEARKLVKQGYKRISLDDLRAMVDNSVYSSTNEKYILEMRNYMVNKAIRKGYNVVVDSTNFHPDREKELRLIAAKFNAGVQVMFIDTPVKECIARDAQRSDVERVGADVIYMMYNRYIKNKNFQVERPLSIEEFEKCQPPVYDPALPWCILVDIDGTLAHNGGHRGFYDWAKVGGDDVDDTIRSITNRYYNDTCIIVMSGRDGVCRPESEEWLARHGINYHEFYMRPEGDGRKDSLIKRELFDDHIRGRFNVMFVLDDRNQVVDMWRNELGLTCLQVAEGDF